MLHSTQLRTILAQRLARMLFISTPHGRQGRTPPTASSQCFGRFCSILESVPYFLKKSNTAAGKLCTLPNHWGGSRSPSRIQPVFRRIWQKTQDRNGRQDKADQDQAQPVKAGGDDGGCPLARASSLGASQPVHTPICPHRPQVPIPELMGAPFISSPNTQVAMGPEMAEASGGIQIRGFFHNVGHLGMEVPRPWGDQTAPAVFLEGHNGEAHHPGRSMPLRRLRPPVRSGPARSRWRPRRWEG